MYCFYFLMMLYDLSTLIFAKIRSKKMRFCEDWVLRMKYFQFFCVDYFCESKSSRSSISKHKKIVHEANKYFSNFKKCEQCKKGIFQIFLAGKANRQIWQFVLNFQKHLFLRIMIFKFFFEVLFSGIR